MLIRGTPWLLLVSGSTLTFLEAKNSERVPSAAGATPAIGAAGCRGLADVVGATAGAGAAFGAGATAALAVAAGTGGTGAGWGSAIATAAVPASNAATEAVAAANLTEYRVVVTFYVLPALSCAWCEVGATTGSAEGLSVVAVPKLITAAEKPPRTPPEVAGL
ncbi:Uncharacterised protein [Mycobacteroides abscessus subsp. abscessus]|nr:Uncharacterised protein [Mycobacteroides abscessus subsp. abscessus]SLJ46337.1 Uncharacterised protein [Mycobacteroides abscessus subsp. massiliense]SHT47390.1 Uncharacterised protein [Mycobacteroides abscessus subsp. abscessus]SHT98504.1 Uncharacterised protein [Mycobacteroides abscessus subsp. abscessus]SHW35935.1 Uncharacterised protein [Mycobacteroides abscessus subsp. abscessus]